MSDPANPAAPTTPPTPAPTTPTPEPAPAAPPTEPTAPAPPVEEGEGTGNVLGETKPEEAAFNPEEIKFPEGFDKNEELFGEFTNIAKEHGLTGPAAQKLVELAAKQTKAATDALLAGWDKQQGEWQAEIKNDKEIGGDKLPGLLQTFSKVANDPELSDPGLREALIYTGAGNHPAVVRTLVRWAKALSEGGPVRGAPGARNSQGETVPTAPQTLGEALYPQGPQTGGPKIPG